MIYMAFFAVTTLTGTWKVVLVAWILPLTLFFQTAIVLRLVVKHVFPASDGPRRGKAYLASLSYGIFLGESVPASYLRGAPRLAAWARWGSRMLLIHFPTRYLVMTGDTVCHDYHHRHPTAKNWAQYLFARQHDIDNGHAGWPPYREVWSLRNAIDLAFDSLTLADPLAYEMSPAPASKRDYTAFDD